MLTNCNERLCLCDDVILEPLREYGEDMRSRPKEVDQRESIVKDRCSVLEKCKDRLAIYYITYLFIQYRPVHTCMWEMSVRTNPEKLYFLLIKWRGNVFNLSNTLYRIMTLYIFFVFSFSIVGLKFLFYKVKCHGTYVQFDFDFFLLQKCSMSFGFCRKTLVEKLTIV